MNSRMERYYEVDSDTSKRTRKNADLYQKIYETDEYSNIEGIATTLKPNEIDISKIKEMLKTRDENTRREKDLKDLMKRPVPRETPKVEDATFEADEKNYDIRDILNKAKSERKEEDSHHKLNHTSYDIFENIKKEPPKEEEEEELKELINTITNTSMLNKLGDQELSLGLLDELKSDTMVGDASEIKAALAEEKAEFENDNFIDDDKQNMDKSFFTSSLNFKEDDFDEIQEMGKSIKKNDTLMNVLIFILLVIFVTCIIFYILK